MTRLPIVRRLDLTRFTAAAPVLAASVLAVLVVPASGPPSEEDQVSRLLVQGRYSEARRLAGSRHERLRAEPGPLTPAGARALDLWIETRIADGDRTLDLLALAEEALVRHEKLLGAGDLRFSATRINLALAVFEIRGDSKRAIEELERAYDLRRRHLGESHLETLKTAVLLANMLRIGGRFENSRALLERACDVAASELGPDSVVLAKLLSARGLLHWQVDEMEAARPLLERSVRIMEKTLGTHPDLALAINRLAILEWAEGRYIEARALYERQLEIQKRTLRPEHPDFGTTWLNIGLLLWRTGDLEGARRFFDRSYSLPVHRESPDHVGRGYQNYARLAIEMGDFERARTLLEKQKELRERLLPPDDPLVLRVYWDLGSLHRETGELDRARDYLLLAQKRSAVVYGGSHTRDAEILHDLALLEERAGDPAAAREHLERAVAITEQAVGRDHPMTGDLLGDLGRILLRQGQLTAAFGLSLEAAETHRRHLSRVARYFSERETLSAEARRLAAIQTAYTILARDAGDSRDAAAARVWDEVVRGRAQALDAIAARHRAALSREGDATTSLRVELEAARRRLAGLFLRGPGAAPPAEYALRLREAEAGKEMLERRLAELDPRAEEASGHRDPGMTEVRASLPAASALVAFVRYADHTSPRTPPARGAAQAPRLFYLGLLLASAGSDPRVVRLGPADDIDRAVDRWRVEASSGPRSHADMKRYLDAGRRLRRIVWDPIAAGMGATDDVFLVPDGSLHLVSFAALPEEQKEQERYLVERIRFHYLSSERDIVPPAAPSRTGRGLLALGGADFDARPGADAATVALAGSSSGAREQGGTFRGIRSACEDFQTMRFQPLPGSRDEATELANLFGLSDGSPEGDGPEPVTLLVGAAAAEGRLKQSAAGHRILHLATHGFLIGEACRSALPGPGERIGGGGAGVRTVVENPLLLSGIALASANRREEAGLDQEDGVLTAEEAASLDLRGVEWAVLSGCGTGLGLVHSAEGVLGLRRAFFVAGAETLILSLWPVEDLAARQWFRLLYGARLAGASTPRAMQQASLALLQRRRLARTTTHPFYWGAFVAAGRWR